MKTYISINEHILNSCPSKMTGRITEYIHSQSLNKLITDLARGFEV